MQLEHLCHFLAVNRHSRFYQLGIFLKNLIMKLEPSLLREPYVFSATSVELLIMIET